MKPVRIAVVLLLPASFLIDCHVLAEGLKCEESVEKLLGKKLFSELTPKKTATTASTQEPGRYLYFENPNQKHQYVVEDSAGRFSSYTIQQDLLNQAQQKRFCLDLPDPGYSAVVHQQANDIQFVKYGAPGLQFDCALHIKAEASAGAQDVRDGIITQAVMSATNMTLSAGQQKAPAAIREKIESDRKYLVSLWKDQKTACNGTTEACWNSTGKEVVTQNLKYAIDACADPKLKSAFAELAKAAKITVSIPGGPNPSAHSGGRQ